ncbi:MAG: hypothetical protein ABSA97_07665 [Verrucomicrobiia bacterium]
MKAHITITDENGTVFEGDAELAQISRTRKTRESPSPKPKPVKGSAQKLDFSKNERHFIKAYARKLSGRKKFVLLLAYLAKGTVGKEVDVKEIQKRWNKMKGNSLLGLEFNRFYPNAAKDDGWVNTPKKGVYVLCSSWKEVLEDNNG